MDSDRRRGGETRHFRPQKLFGHNCEEIVVQLKVILPSLTCYHPYRVASECYKNVIINEMHTRCFNLWCTHTSSVPPLSVSTCVGSVHSEGGQHAGETAAVRIPRAALADAS